MKAWLVSLSVLMATACATLAQDAPPPRAQLGLPIVVENPQPVAAPFVEGHAPAALQPEKDAKPIARIIGRINADTIFVSQSLRNQQIFGIVDNAVGFRRARLGAEGEVGESVYWKAEFDFAGGNIAFRDVYIGLQNVPFLRRIQVGHMTEPFSLEGQISSNYLPWVERSVAYLLDPDRNWGVLARSYTEDERVTFQLGVFRSGTSNSSGNDISNLNDMAYDVRVTALPWYEADGARLLHVGGAFSERFPANGEVVVGTGPQNSLLQFNDSPSTFIEQITIPASQYQIYNLELATVLGSFSAQADWNGMSVEQRGGESVFLYGFYAGASYYLTGEHRAYDTKDGKFDMTQVLRPFVSLRGHKPLGGGPGAWELVARFAYARLTNGNIPLQNGVQQGDNEAETVFGVNWYLNDYTRIMFNYVHVVPVSPNAGPSYANAYFLRCAIFW